MSTWNEIQKLPSNYQAEIYSCYTEFPVEIRMLFADWIERQNWDYFLTLCNSSEPEFSQNQQINELFEDFANQIQNLLGQYTNDEFCSKLKTFLFNLKPPRNRICIINFIQRTLLKENNIIQEFQKSSMRPTIMNENNFFGKCQADKISEIENKFKKINQTKELLNLKLNSLHYIDKIIKKHQQGIEQVPNMEAVIHNQSILKNEFDQLNKHYRQNTEDFLNKCEESIININSNYNILINEHLNPWKRMQSSGNQNLDIIFDIKNLCAGVAENIWKMWILLKSYNTLISDNQENDFIFFDRLTRLKTQIIDLLRRLVNDTFVIKDQPKQVIKKETKFTASVSLLVGKEINIGMNPPEVKVSIINENQAKQWYSQRYNFQPVSSCGEIINNTIRMENNSSSGDLSANFCNLQLKKIIRTEKKGSESSVVDEKFALLFSTEIFIEQDLKFSVNVLSVPVVVIVHGNQEAQAQATITWDNAFSEPSRCPFDVPNEVKFSQLAQVLSQKFFEAACRGLSDENIGFLADKLAGDYEKAGSSDIMVSWSKFSKEHLQGQSFTFWDWFYAILKLTREYLSDVWKEGLVIGFLSRWRAKALLLDKAPGTFLLRFSDTKLGGISVAYVQTPESSPSDKECIMVDPFLASDLKIRKLADRLKDISEFCYLYPNIPKDTAFSVYYTKENNKCLQKNGYVRPQLRNYIPGLHSNTNNNIPITDSDSEMQSLIDNSSNSILASSIHNGSVPMYTMDNFDSNFTQFSHKYEDDLNDFNFD